MVIWDDGKHTKVKKVKVTYTNAVILAIQVDYFDGGNTVHGDIHHGTFGIESADSAEFELYSDEDLTELTIYETTIPGSLTFKSTQRSFGPYGKLYQGFRVREIKSSAGFHIVGFHGNSNRYLDCLHVHFGPNSSGAEKLDAKGGKEGQLWDDGDNHGSVTKVIVGVGPKGVHHIKFEYDKSGRLNDAPTHGLQNETFLPPLFKIDHPHEYLVSVVGYYDVDIVQSLQFITNKRESQAFGYDVGTKFTLEVKDKKIVGFHGYANMTLNSLGAHFLPISSSSSSSLNKVEVIGGKGGKEWDDGADHSGVTKIVAGVGRRGVHYIQFDYDKSGTLKDGPVRGLINGALSPPQTFEIEDPNEYLVSVIGYYENDKILGLQFKTNKRESQVIGYCDAGTKFTLEVKNRKIVGFHGYANTTLNSLGAYFVNIPSSFIEILEVQGGKGGKEWDDGTDQDGTKKIVVGVGRKGVHYMKFDYYKSGQLKDGPVHGLINETISPPPTFNIDHPDEYLLSLMGYYDGNIIQGFQFKTNKRESQVFGYGKGTKFTLEVKKKKIVGFHGYSDTYMNSLGAYFAPISSSSPFVVNKLDAQGGKGETTFDDGTFDGVRKVYVGQGDSSVTYVKFEYEKGGKVETFDHGKRGMLGTEEFELENDEYITSVEGFYDKIYGHKEAVIAALTFKTSKMRISPQFGISGGEKFMLDSKDGKLVGFHGSVDEVLHSLGAYFAPSTTPLIPVD